MFLLLCTPLHWVSHSQIQDHLKKDYSLFFC
ncbi:MAG: hypothetical protein IV095_06725 [Sediminibacterium sp.]|nr:hypothetical protein [Sediminibacterium sp.]